MSDLVGNAEDSFSRGEAHLTLSLLVLSIVWTHSNKMSGLIWTQNYRQTTYKALKNYLACKELNYGNMILYPIGHCIAMLGYAVFRYLVKLTELETSWGRGDTVTY